MGDDYQVIARAVRQPMRKWWRRVGAPWIALIIALLVLLIVSALVELTWLQATRGGLMHTPRSAVIDWLSLVQWGIIPLCTLLWMLASFRALATLDSLSRDTTIATLTPRLLVYRFRLVLSQAVWPAILASAYHVTSTFYHASRFIGTEHWSVELMLSPLTELGAGLLFVIQAMWIAVLLIQLPQSRPLIWLWWFAIISSWLWCLSVFLGMQIDLPELPSISFQEIDPIERGVLKCTGFLFSVTAVYLITAGKRSGIVLSYVLGSLGVLASWHIGVSTDDPAQYSHYTFYIDYLLSHLYALPTWDPVVWPRYPNFFFEPRIDIFFIVSYASFPLPFWLCWIALPFQAAIAYGYYWFFRWLLVLGATRRPAGNASADSSSAV